MATNGAQTNGTQAVEADHRTQAGRLVWLCENAFGGSRRVMADALRISVQTAKECMRGTGTARQWEEVIRKAGDVELLNAAWLEKGEGAWWRGGPTMTVANGDGSKTLYCDPFTMPPASARFIKVVHALFGTDSREIASVLGVDRRDLVDIFGGRREPTGEEIEAVLNQPGRPVRAEYLRDGIGHPFRLPSKELELATLLSVLGPTMMADARETRKRVDAIHTAVGAVRSDLDRLADGGNATERAAAIAARAVNVATAAEEHVQAIRRMVDRQAGEIANGTERLTIAEEAVAEIETLAKATAAKADQIAATVEAAVLRFDNALAAVAKRFDAIEAGLTTMEETKLPGVLERLDSLEDGVTERLDALEDAATRPGESSDQPAAEPMLSPRRALSEPDLPPEMAMQTDTWCEYPGNVWAMILSDRNVRRVMSRRICLAWRRHGSEVEAHGYRRQHRVADLRLYAAWYAEGLRRSLDGSGPHPSHDGWLACWRAAAGR
jgi:hypothetical protein